jgi:hypothetical protein
VEYRYGLSPVALAGMREEQGGLCASCGQPPSLRRPLVVDHDHETGAVRGLLCDACNTSLGQLRDDPTRILALLDYLERTKP